jgi:uncharacterized protein (TIGR02246 family)
MNAADQTQELTMMTAALSALAAPFLALAATGPAPAVDSGIVELMAEVDRAWNAHDADQQVALYADDGTVVTPSGTRAVGKPEIRKISGGKGPTGQTQSKTTIDGVQQLAPNLVLIDATQKLTGPGTKILGTDRARVVVVARKVKGKWKAVSVRPFPQFAKSKSGRTAKR